MATDGMPVSEQFHSLLCLGRFKEAQSLAIRRIALEPDSAEGYAMMASVMLYTKRLVEARHYCRQAVERSPEWDYSYRVMGWAVVADESYVPASRQTGSHRQVALRRLPYALELAATALQIDPTSADNWQLRAHILLLADREDEAIQAAREGLACDPSHEGCSFELLKVLFKTRRLEELQVLAEEFLSIHPECAKIHSILAEALMRRGDFAPAVEHAKEAIRLNPTDRQCRQVLLSALKVERPFLSMLMRARFITQSLLFHSIASPCYWLTGATVLLSGIIALANIAGAPVIGIALLITGAAWLFLPFLLLLVLVVLVAATDALAVSHRHSPLHWSSTERFVSWASLIAVALGLSVIFVYYQLWRREIPGNATYLISRALIIGGIAASAARLKGPPRVAAIALGIVIVQFTGLIITGMLAIRSQDSWWVQRTAIASLITSFIILLALFAPRRRFDRNELDS
jgi:tetratricopeptide (TPR) repeat protein